LPERPVLVFHSPYMAWCLRVVERTTLRCVECEAEPREVMPFTFAHVPPPLRGGCDVDVVLKPSGGFKS
jgi:hypothetical protein